MAATLPQGVALQYKKPFTRDLLPPLLLLSVKDERSLQVVDLEIIISEECSKKRKMSENYQEPALHESFCGKITKKCWLWKLRGCHNKYKIRIITPTLHPSTNSHFIVISTLWLLVGGVNDILIALHSVVDCNATTTHTIESPFAQKTCRLLCISFNFPSTHKVPTPQQQRTSHKQQSVYRKRGFVHNKRGTLIALCYPWTPSRAHCDTDKE